MSGFDARVALLPWGNVIEDFLDPIGLSLDEFREEMTGGWLFGYVGALGVARVDTVIVCVSGRVSRPERHRHGATGALISILPAPRGYHVARRRLRDPYGWSRRDAVGHVRGARLAAALVAREAAPYLALPLLALGREIRRLGCSALLCQEYESPRFDAAVLLGRLLGLPVFATFQGGDVQFTTLERLVRPRAIRDAAGLVIGPAQEADRVRDRYRVPPEKIAPIPNPLDLAAWEPVDRRAVRAELGIPDGARVVAWHGRVDLHRKGLDVLADAWRRLCEVISGVRLLLVGTGPDAAALRERLAPDDRVIWLDEYLLDRARMRRLLSAADVYAFPSRIEGLPVAPLEAMAVGLPVVAARIPGTQQIFEHGEGDGGVLVPAGDADALASELARLLEDDTRRAELARRARTRVEAGFSPEAVGTKLREFFTAGGLATRP